MAAPRASPDCRLGVVGGLVGSTTCTSKRSERKRRSHDARHRQSSDKIWVYCWVYFLRVVCKLLIINIFWLLR
jgi:hypothetical protein